MQSVILAAGMGTRIASQGPSKPLLRLLGRPLIEWVIRSAMQAGVREFVVVTGYQAATVETFLHGLAERLDVSVIPVRNDRWQEANGLSALRVLGWVRDPFILQMSDHLFDAQILRQLQRQPVGRDQVMLAVDRGVGVNQRIDLDDVTRVQEDSGRIVAIGKGIPGYNAYDTGIFLCSRSLFDAIETSQARHADASLSGAMRVLAGSGRALTFDVGNLFWMDIDTEHDLRAAAVCLEQRGTTATGLI